MKILLVCEDVPHPQLGGLGRHALALAQELHRRGHAVDLLGNATHAPQPGQGGPGRFFAAIRGHERGWKQRALGAFHPFAAPLNAAALARAIVRHAAGYDVVHYHGHLPWVAAQLPATLPFTQTRHDVGGDCMLRTRFTPQGRRCERRDPAACAACASARPAAWQRLSSTLAVRRLRRATATAYARPVIFVSEHLRQGFAQAAGSPPAGEVIHNAVDLPALRSALGAAAAAGGRADGGLVPPAAGGRAEVELFAAGAMYPYKGFGPLLDEIAAQGGLPPGWRLTLAGDGPEAAALRARHASPAIRFLGWCGAAEVAARTADADAVLVPSLWDEPCATTVLEALALGRTVYALRRGGTPELACYAGPHGERLRLFDELPALVVALRRHRGRNPAPADSLDTFPGSVAAMAERVLAHYATRLGAA